MNIIIIGVERMPAREHALTAACEVWSLWHFCIHTRVRTHTHTSIHTHTEKEKEKERERDKEIKR
jgi:hypothetical protein